MATKTGPDSDRPDAVPTWVAEWALERLGGLLGLSGRQDDPIPADYPPDGFTKMTPLQRQATIVDDMVIEHG